MVANGFEETYRISSIDIILDGKAEHIDVDQVNLQMSYKYFLNAIL